MNKNLFLYHNLEFKLTILTINLDTFQRWDLTQWKAEGGISSQRTLWKIEPYINQFLVKGKIVEGNHEM